MEFATHVELDALEVDARRVGTMILTGGAKMALEMLQYHSYYVAAGVEDHLKGSGVTVTKNGDFICVMVDTLSRNPVSFSRNNLNDMRGISLGPLSETLETVRQAYERHLTSLREAV